MVDNKQELWLVRHGETEWAATKRHTGRTDIPLTETGVLQGKALVLRLAGHSFALVLSSPLQRAAETCRLAGYGERAEFSNELLEWDYGLYEGRTMLDIRMEKPGWTIWTDDPPGGETLSQVARRADMAIARVVGTKRCLAYQGKGFKGQARGAEFSGKLRYDEIDRWHPIAVSEHPYDLELCDLCVRQCPIEIRIAQCDSGKPPSGDVNQCPPQHAIQLQPLDDDSGRMQPVIMQGCVGCGVCDMICPLSESVFVMDSAESRGMNT